MPLNLASTTAVSSGRERCFSLRPGPALEGLTTLELGCGTGLSSLAAAARGASSVATDISPLSLQLTTHAAAEQGLDVQAQFQPSCRSRTPCHRPPRPHEA